MKKDTTNQNQKKSKSISKNDVIDIVFASSIINNTSDAVIATNLKGEITLWNNGAVQLYGFTSEEVLGKNISMIYRKEDLPTLGERLKKVIQGENLSNVEVTVIDKSKNEHIVLLSINGLKDDKGKINQLVGFTKDITEIKAAQIKLTETEALYTSAFSAIGEGFVVQDLSDKILSANQAAADILGLTMNQLLGKDSFDPRWKALHEDGSPFKPEEHPSVITTRTGNPVSNVTMNVHSGKDVRKWISINSRPVFDSKSIQTITVTTFLDISEQRLAQQTLKESEQRFSQAFDNSPIPISVLNLKTGRRLAVNNAFCNTFGYSKGDLINEENIHRVNLAINRKEFKLAINKVLSGRDIFEHPFSMYTKSGEIRNVLINATKAYANNDDIYIVSFLDITNRKIHEENLKASEEKYRTLFEQSLVGIGMAQGNEVVFGNKTMMDIFNYDTLEEFKKIPLIDHIAPDYRDLIKNRIKDGLSNKGKNLSPEYEYDILCKGGEIKTVIGHTSYMEIAGEIFAQTIVSDITDRKKTEIKLKESEINISAILNSLPSSVCVIDDTGKILQVNHAWNEFGESGGHKKPRELYAEYNYFDVCRTDNKDENAKAILEGIMALLKGDIDRFEHEYPCHSPDKKQWFIMRADLMKTKEKQVVISHINITSRKVSEEHLKDTLSQLSMAVDSAKLGVWSHTIKTDNLEWNEELFKIYGVDSTEFDYKMDSFQKLVHPEDLEYVMSHQGQVSDLEFRIIRPNKEVRYINGSILPIIVDGEVDKIIGINQDVSEIKIAEQELRAALNEITELKLKVEAENIYLKEELKLEGNYQEIIGSNKSLTKVLKQVEQVAKTDATVLILGETGTGKELVARAIHDSSKRRSKPLVRVNCAALPTELIESELFGHEKGSFTGAVNRKIGRFELAHNGTIFLDEIGELPIEMQTRLLRVLQEQEFERIGGEVTIKVDVRVMAATNRNLEQRVIDGEFRQDLYYRLNVFPIVSPSLKERLDDIPELINHFINKYNAKYNHKIKSVHQSVFDDLLGYNWPGNIRELEHIVQRAMIINQGSQLRLGKWFVNKNTDNNVSEKITTLEVKERDYIIKVLDLTKWKVRGKNGASEILGLKPTTLESRMKKLNIKR